MHKTIPAKWVIVVKGLQRAECLIPGCGWTGDVHGTYQEANAERTEHLEKHRNAGVSKGPVNA